MTFQGEPRIEHVEGREEVLPGIFLRLGLGTENDRISLAPDVDLLALEAELLGQAHGLAATILEQFGRLHQLAFVVYTSRSIPYRRFAQLPDGMGLPLAH